MTITLRSLLAAGLLGPAGLHTESDGTANTTRLGDWIDAGWPVVTPRNRRR